MNAHPGSGAYTNAFEIATELEGAGLRAQARAVAITRHYGMLMETAIKARASGRPGPRAVTGDYRRSWTTTYDVGFGGIRAVIGTNRPQGRRLEYGFVGADRIGRVYNQPPFPHASPGFDQVAPAYGIALGEVLTLGGGTS